MQPKQWLIGLGLASTLFTSSQTIAEAAVDERDVAALSIHEFPAEHKSDRPAILLIPGFTSHYHQDTAVFAALIPVLQQQYNVYSIDWALHQNMLANASHKYMAEAIQHYLSKLTQDVLVVSFASGNLTSSLLLQPSAATNLRAQIWIDPDVLTPSSVAFYQDYPVSWYREKLPELLPFLAADGWRERALERNQTERAEMQRLSANQAVDWNHYDALSEPRTSALGQQLRAALIARYHDDLASIQVPTTTAIPISILNTDFESQYLADETLAAEAIEKIERWQADGDRWMPNISAQTGGLYLYRETEEHLLMVAEPQTVAAFIAATVALVSAEDEEVSHRRD